MSAADGDDEDLEAQVRSGLSWSFGSSILSRLTTFLVGILMARLLAPTEYGEFTVALVAMTILVNINDLGVEQSLVRWPGRLERVAPTATTIIFGFSCLLYALCFAGAPAFARALGAPEATPIVQVLCLGLLFNGAFAVPSATLTRSFRQDRRTAADMTGFLTGIIVTVVLALMGYGAWAMAWGRLVGNGSVSILHFVLTPQRFRPGWDRGVAKELMRHSLPLGGATLVAVALLNVDYVVVGRLLGTEQLGFYTLAFNLASWPVTFFAVAVARVSVPAFGRLQHDRVRLQSAYDRTSQLLLAVTVPTCILLAVFAEPLVLFLYGVKWAPAVTVLRLLAGLGLLRVLYQFWADVLVAVGASRRVLLTQACWIAGLVPGLTIATQWALGGVGVAQLIVALGVTGPVYLLCLRGIIDVGSAFHSFLPVAGAAVVAGLAGTAVSALGFGPFWTLAIGTPVVLAAYLLTGWRAFIRLGLNMAKVRPALGRLRRRRSVPDGGAE